MWSQIQEFLNHHIVTLRGVVLTPGAIVASVFVIAFGRIVARFAGKSVAGLLARRGAEEGAQFAAAKVVRYVFNALTALVAISTLGIEINALLAGSAVLLVGLGFGLQHVAENFIAGIVLLIEQPIKRGDFVRIGDATGSVADIGLRATRVITRDEVTIIVPNGQLISAQVVNHSAPSANLRVEVVVGVAYGSDVPRVRETLLAVAAAEPEVLATPATEVRFLDFGDSSLVMSLLVWVAEPRDDMRIASKLRFAIDAAFRANKITIPFPQRDLHLKSGFEAGRTVAGVASNSSTAA